MGELTATEAMRQGVMTAHEYLRGAIDRIDIELGAGYAKKTQI